MSVSGLVIEMMAYTPITNDNGAIGHRPWSFSDQVALSLARREEKIHIQQDASTFTRDFVTYYRHVSGTGRSNVLHAIAK
jgi:hypothetical protein